jgi:hypothetical protein
MAAQLFELLFRASVARIELERPLIAGHTLRGDHAARTTRVHPGCGRRRSTTAVPPDRRRQAASRGRAGWIGVRGACGPSVETGMKRLLGVAARLYPSWWRQRYESEFDALLEDVRPGWRELRDVITGALTMQIKTVGTIPVVCAAAIHQGARRSRRGQRARLTSCERRGRRYRAGPECRAESPGLPMAAVYGTAATTSCSSASCRQCWPCSCRHWP